MHGLNNGPMEIHHHKLGEITWHCVLTLSLQIRTFYKLYLCIRVDMIMMACSPLMAIYVAS